MYFGKGSRRYKKTLGENDVYKYYSSVTKNSVSRGEFSEISKDIGSGIMRMLIYDNFVFYMPFRLGDICIRKKEKHVKILDDGSIALQHLRVDWERTLNHWAELYPNMTPDEIRVIPKKKKFYHLNEDVNGYVAYFNWSKYTANFRNKSAYLFKPVRQYKRELGTYIKKTHKMNYYE